MDIEAKISELERRNHSPQGGMGIVRYIDRHLNNFKNI